MGDQMRFFASQAPQSAKGKAAKPDGEAPEYLWPGYRGPDQAGWTQMDHINRIREDLYLMRSGDKTQAGRLWAQMDLESTENEPDVATQKKSAVQPKLTVSEPDDPLEKEADEVAERVMRSPLPTSTNRPAISPFARSLQKYTLPDSLRDETGAPKPNPLLGRMQRSRGNVLPESSRAFFGSHFGRDFDNVRVHTDQAAHIAADSIQAKAFTHGNEIYFNKDQYAPGTNDGDRLIAHELTHVVQQSGGQGAIQREADPRAEFVEGLNEASARDEIFAGINASIKIKKGDKLENLTKEINEKYKTNFDIYEIAFYNGIENTDRILAGQMLQIPPFELGIKTDQELVQFLNEPLAHADQNNPVALQRQEIAKKYIIANFGEPGYSAFLAGARDGASRGTIVGVKSNLRSILDFFVDRTDNPAVSEMYEERRAEYVDSLIRDGLPEKLNSLKSEKAQEAYLLAYFNSLGSTVGVVNLLAISIPFLKGSLVTQLRRRLLNHLTRNRFAPYWKYVEKINGRVINEFSALRPGPLVPKVSNAFSGGRYVEVKLTQKIVLYRVWEPGKAAEFGAFWSLEKPGGSLQAIIDSAILPKWQGATRYTVIAVPKGATVYVGEVGYQKGFYLGGGSQIIIKDRANPKWAIETGVLK